jgi:hypothetical protein
VLLILVGLLVIAWPRQVKPISLLERLKNAGVLLGAYFLIMLPWFLRSLDVLGTPLPAGGVNTAFLKGYNDIFSYPAEWTLPDFLDWGAGNILESRWEALLIAFQTWFALECLIALAPFALWALWKRRREPFLAPMIWYAIGLHLAMSLVFTFPGSRGGLFHSSAALFPFWVALGLAGLDDGIAWLGRVRRWRIGEAQLVFGSAALLFPTIIAVFAWNAQNRNWESQPSYTTYAKAVPEDARLMVNDPAAWYYHTGHEGVTLPNESLETAFEIAQRYCITHLIIDKDITPAFTPLLEGQSPPPFLTEIQHFEGSDSQEWRDDVRVYAFDVACTP